MPAMPQLIAGLCHYDGKIAWDAAQPNGQPRRCLYISRAERRFAFRAKTTLHEGLAATVRWYAERCSAFPRSSRL